MSYIERRDLRLVLEEILQKNKDAVVGFDKAANNAVNVKFRSYFRRKSIEREQFNIELADAMKGVYTEFDMHGSFVGTMHRVWMDVRIFFSKDSDTVLLKESIRGDSSAIDEYDEVLGHEFLPLPVREILQTQREQLERDLAMCKGLGV